MSDRIAAGPQEGTPPHMLGGFPQDVLKSLLGAWPDNLTRHDVERLTIGGVGPLAKADQWPEDLEAGDFFYRGLTRLLWERGGAIDAAQSIRRDLQAGRLAAAVLLPKGELWPLAPSRFQGEESRRLWWTGFAEVHVSHGVFIGRYEGAIYLVTPPEAAPETPPLDLSESDSLCKLLLHLVGKKSSAQIAAQSTGTEYAVPERTVSDLVKKARDQLAEKLK